ncbi:hypothetical protein DICA4_D31758 [Diutina catenulata]
MVIITHLDPPVESAVSALTLRLNNDLIDEFKRCLSAGIKPKLVVKDGLMSIKVEAAEYPCIKIPETLNVDVYSSQGASRSRYDGRVATKLSVITDAKKIRDYLRDVERRKHEATPASPVSYRESSPDVTRVAGNPFAVSSSDPPATVATKFIQLLALGPASDADLTDKLGAVPLAQLKTDYAQVYDPNNAFYQDDRFPTVERRRRLGGASDSDGQQFILKDKSYKEFQPWDWTFYSAFERKLVLQNIHRALTRLGYSETHPLRRKLGDPTAPAASAAASPAAALGGGRLSSKRGSPVRSLPAKRKLSSSSSSSSDDDKHPKRPRGESDTSPSSEDDDTPLSRRAPATPVPAAERADKPDKRMDYYTQLAGKFRERYKEYASLYARLQNPANTSKAESKRQLLKLFEMHTQLSQWKKTLWDYDHDAAKKADIMALSKHKNSPRATPPPGSRSSSAAPKAKFSLNY